MRHACRPEGTRSYAIDIPDASDGHLVGELRRDGEVVLCWESEGQTIVAPERFVCQSLAGGIVHLAQNPDQQDKVRANPALIGNMIEAVLRLDTPTAGMWRLVTKDTELGGRPYKAGEMIMLRYAAANRDPAKYPDPDTFDVERTNARTHLAFGKGIHMCVGNMLSRKEMTVAFTELLRRLDDIRIKDGAELKVSPNLLLRGFVSVPITYKKAGA